MVQLDLNLITRVHYLASNMYHIFVERMVRNSWCRLVCSHNSKYRMRYTRAPGTIFESAHDSIGLLMKIMLRAQALAQG